jgi:hypothetical protein
MPVCDNRPCIEKLNRGDSKSKVDVLRGGSPEVCQIREGLVPLDLDFSQRPRLEGSLRERDACVKLMGSSPDEK